MSGYPQTLKYFMWPWQVYFNISCRTSAESLFNQLDRGLKPNVFLVGVIVNNQKEKFPICLEPEDVHYSVDEFKNISSKARVILENDEEQNIIYSGPGMQEEMDERLRRKSAKLAIQEILNTSPNNKGNTCFVSSSVRIGDYEVYIVLELDKITYKSHFHLSKKNKEDRMKISFSLLESTKDIFIKSLESNIHLPNPGKNLSSEQRPSEELLREAAKQFMYTISWAGKNGQGIHGLFETCNKTSISKYEGIENRGLLIIAKKDHPNISMTFEVEEPFSLHDSRKLRKLLELSEANSGVVSDSYLVYGLGQITANYNKDDESIFIIKFNGIHCWDVIHADKVLMKMKYGMPEFQTEIIDQLKFSSDAKRIFSNINNNQLESIFELALSATLQKKGALLIITENAAEEAKRLRSQCINLKPIKLTPEALISLTSIDGGVLIDLNGTAHASGVILDGIVGVKGDSARGSRFNSAVTYYEYNKDKIPVMIVVISEDGMINVIPQLMPQIKHSEILNIISILNQLNSDDKFNRKVFYQAMEWLKNRKFYLTKSECKTVNKLKLALQSLDQKLSSHTVWIQHEDFYPNLDMNDTYYIHQ